MSYLDSPRIHFSGWFQADVSTINNDVRFFQNDSFVPDYQQLNSNGSWNPQGTGIFRILDCSVTGGFFKGRALTTPSDDAVIGLTLQNADDRPPGKLVDLDPQQQMVSQIWGMQVRLAGAQAEPLFEGEYKPAAFTNLWFRQQTAAKRDQQLCAYYQSVLENVKWSGNIDSPLLAALKDATQDEMLSIHFNVYGYGRDSTIPRYTMGHLVGTIGPYLSGEPKHFVRGRHMIAYIADMNNWPVVDSNVNSLQARVAADGLSLTADFGNTFPIVDASGAPMDIGQVQLGVLRTNPPGHIATVDASEIVLIGEVPYLNEAWYTQTAGVQTFDLTGNTAAHELLPGNPLVLVTLLVGSTHNVLLQESIDGQYVRADSFVYRMNPGETQQVEFYATRFGQPLASSKIKLSATEGFMGGSGGGATVSPTPRPAAAIPDIGKPKDAFGFIKSKHYKSGLATSVSTDAGGRAVFDLAASPEGPENARGYIAGQLYGIGYQLADQPPGYISNPLDYVSVLVFDKKDIPDKPTWYQDIQHLFTQYGNLYPIMSRYVVDLADYDAVVERIAILQLAFSLPMCDPNHMPVTRDLGEGDRQTVLKWLSSPGPDGKPLLGSPPTVAAPAPLTPSPAPSLQAPMIELEPLQGGGKTSFILQYQARRRAKLERESEGEK